MTATQIDALATRGRGPHSPHGRSSPPATPRIVFRTRLRKLPGERQPSCGRLRFLVSAGRREQAAWPRPRRCFFWSSLDRG